MRRSRCSGLQIVHVLQQAEAGVPIDELLRKYGISQPTFYAWRKKYAGMSGSEATRLKQIEEENGRLKRPPARAGWRPAL